VAAADAATSTQCSHEVVDTTLVLAQVRSQTDFDASKVSEVTGRRGPAMLSDEEFGIYGADDDGNGVASPHDVGDAVFALTRLDCALVSELVARGRPTDPVSVLAAWHGGVEYMDHPDARRTAEAIWAAR
jgi:hypothetical protein